MVDQKAPDLPPSYRLDMGSPAHHMMMLAAAGGGQQQDYVDMDGVLMNGSGGPTAPPPISQLYPTMSTASGNFFGSRGDDLNGMDDICKVYNNMFITLLCSLWDFRCQLPLLFVDVRIWISLGGTN